MKTSILFIVPETYEALKSKGVEKMILERDENGFFEQVITLHPFSNKTYHLKLNDCHEVYEIGFDLLPGGKNNRLFYYLQLPIHFFRIIFKALWLVKKYNLDIIRANDPFWMGLFGYICSRICKIPFCVSIHADYDKRVKLDKNITLIKVFGSYEIAKWLESFILSKANMILPIRQSLAVKAITSGAKEEKVKVIPHGIDLTPFNSHAFHKTRQLFNIDSKIKIISFVGRLSKENYVYDILEVSKILSKKRKDFLIVMAGGGKEENRIKQIVASDSLLNKHILLVGFKPREICLDIRRTSDVSLCLMGGFSLIEACAAERPVISYNVEWHSELIKNNETGFLIPERDVNGVAKVLDWLLDHSEESKKMGGKAKCLAFKNHNINSTSKMKIKCYSELLSWREGN